MTGESDLPAAVNHQVRTIDIAWNEAEKWFRSIADARSRWVEGYWTDAYEAIVDGERAGLLLIDAAASSSVHLVAIAVSKDHRNSGVGSALIKRAIEEHKRVYGDVRNGNQAGIALFESMGLTPNEGYQPTGPVVRYSLSKSGNGDRDA